MRGAYQRPADRAGPAQPFVGEDRGGAEPLGHRVVLEQDRPPPVDHGLLDRDRAGRRGVHRPAHAAQVVGRTHRVRQLQQPDEHGRHPLTVRHPVGLDERQRLLRLEPLHHHDGRPGAVAGHAPGQRGGVVERSGGQVHVTLPHAEELAEPVPGDVGMLTQRLPRDRPLDPLRPPGGPRAVQHDLALALVGDGGRRQRGYRVLVGIPAGDRAADHQPPHIGSEHGAELGGEAGEPRADNDHPGIAVGDDVSGLIGCQVPVDGGELQAGPLCTPGQVEELWPVLRDHRQAVARTQPAAPGEPGHLVGAGLQLGIGHHRAGGPHHDRRAVRLLSCEDSWVHESILPMWAERTPLS